MQQTPKLLVVDDDEELAAGYCKILQDYGYDASPVNCAEEAQAKINEEFFDLLILDQRMTGISGTDLLEACRQRYPGIGAIFITGFRDPSVEKKALDLGALRFLHKGAVSSKELIATVRVALEDTQVARESRRSQYAVRSRETFAEIIGESAAIKEAIEQARAMSRSKAPVLLIGETGTGKELFARAIHNERLVAEEDLPATIRTRAVDHQRVGDRKKRPFVAVNAANISKELAESFLFGHRKGAFTGAVENREGCFQTAHTGTLFLDEVGDLPGDCQAKLLRVLEDGKFTRVGDSEANAVTVDVRVITATKKNLEDMTHSGGFRDDLYYRLAVLPIRLPPLRERGEDIVILTMHLLFRHSLEAGKAIKRVTAEAVAKLKAYTWPGNVRELGGVLERSVILAKTDVIDAKDILGIDRAPHVVVPRSFSDLPFKEAEREFQRGYFEELLARTDGNVTMAADKAGLDRSTVHDYLKKLGISRKDRG